MFFGQQLAGATQAGLDFIQDEDDIILRTDGSGFLQITIRRYDHAGLALNGFCQKGHRFGCDGSLERITIAKGNNLKTGREGAEIFPRRFIGAETNDGNGTPVKIVVTNDNLSLILRNPFDLIAPLANRFDDRFHRLGATVHRQYLVRIGQFTEFFIKQPQLIIAKGPGCEGQYLGLFDHSAHNFRVAMALIDR